MSEAPTFREAFEQITGPGGPFEVGDVEILGNRMPAFKTAPPTLRAFFDLARTRGDAEYLVYEDERLSYADVVERVDALAAALVGRFGVEPGDRVAISMRNYPEWVLSFFAATSVGAIAVALNAWWTTEELQYGLADCEPKVLIVDDERLERLAPLLGTVDVGVVAVRMPDADLPEGVARLEDVTTLGTAMPEVEIDPDSDATILYTSGTTGHPKGVVSTHRAVLNALWSFAARTIAVAISSPAKESNPFPTCYILVVPLFHVTGLVPVLLGSTLGGYKLVMMYRWDPERALELIERERVTVFVGVPTQSHDLLESPSFASTDTSSLRSVGGGGSAAAPELVKRIESSFSAGRPQIGYGMTETNAYGPGNSGDDYVRKPASTGRAIPTCRVKIVDPLSGAELAPGEVGEVCMAGPHLFRGYWRRPEETAAVLSPDGWLRTGDLGYVDDEDFLFIVDRAKDIVIRGGENISCIEVEGVVYAHPDVYECAVFGLPHDRLGEELAVAVHPKPGRTIEPEDLQRHVGEHLAAFKVPSKVLVWDEQLPRNASGKIVKREVREAALSQGD